MKSIPTSQLFAMGGRHSIPQLLRQAQEDVAQGDWK